MGDNSMENKINCVTDSINEVLKEKNRRYGNSALKPLEIFTGKIEPMGLGVRIDDKLSRIKNTPPTSSMLRKNDVFDLIGYLTLLCVNNDWTDFSDLID